MSKHQCAEFTYEKDYGAEIITDDVVRPLSEISGWVGRPVSEFWSHDELVQEWDRISVHGYEAHEGITSGHVWKFVDGGVIIGDILLTW